MGYDSIFAELNLVKLDDDISEYKRWLVMTTVTQYIKDNLKARIQSENPLPYRLTLADISRYYGVSLMPVRQAVNDLVAEEIIVRKENGRLYAKNKRFDSSFSVAEAEIDLQSPKSALVQAINNDMITRSLVQNTDYLREEATAAKYGVGRTMVRQVFTRLSGEGVMEHVPRCGWRVRPYREGDMLAYLDVREVMELKALRLAFPRLDRQALKQFLENNKPTPGDTAARLDNGLHVFWIERCGNRYITEFFKRNGEYYQQLFNYAVLGENMTRVMAEEHCSILECLLEDKLEVALSLLSEHIREQRKNITEVISFLKIND